MGIDHTYLSKLECGHETNISYGLIRRFAAVLEGNETELLLLVGKLPEDIATILRDAPLAIEVLRLARFRGFTAEDWRRLLRELPMGRKSTGSRTEK